MDAVERILKLESNLDSVVGIVENVVTSINTVNELIVIQKKMIDLANERIDSDREKIAILETKVDNNRRSRNGSPDNYNWKMTGPGGCDAHNIEHPCGPCITGKTRQ